MKPSLLVLFSLSLALDVSSHPSITPLPNLARQTPSPQLHLKANPSPLLNIEIELRERAVTATTSISPLQTALCGWLGGDPGQPWTCAVDGQCVIATAPATNAVGCCVSGKCAPFRTSCIPATAQCDASCSSEKGNLICNTASPLCATFTYPGSYTELRCTNSIPPQNQLQVAFTFSGFTTPLPLPRVLSTMTSCDAASICVPDLTVLTQIPIGTTTTKKSSTQTSKTATSSTEETTSSTSTPPTSSSNTGAIIGGVIGGIGGVALLGGGIFLYYMRKKRRAGIAGSGSAAALGGAQNPYYSPNPQSNGEGQVYGGAVKAELPTTQYYGMEAAKVPEQREAWEMNGVVRQDTPLMEMEAHDTRMR